MTFKPSAGKLCAGLLVALLLTSAASADDVIYRVVKNMNAEQYSVWPANMELPLGWGDVGVSGSRQDCLDYIQQQQQQ
jgi:uncharacterized protein YbdZ (MbtH family)